MVLERLSPPDAMRSNNTRETLTPQPTMPDCVSCGSVSCPAPFSAYSRAELHLNILSKFLGPSHTGYVGEPSLVGDGSIMYFVHVMVNDEGVYGSNIW